MKQTNGNNPALEGGGSSREAPFTAWLCLAFFEMGGFAPQTPRDGGFAPQTPRYGRGGGMEWL
jgi:hypothetical protein